MMKNYGPPTVCWTCGEITLPPRSAVGIYCSEYSSMSVPAKANTAPANHGNLAPGAKPWSHMRGTMRRRTDQNLPPPARH